MAKSDDSHLLSQLYIVLLAVAASALVIAIYHCVSVLRWNRHQHHQRSRLNDEQLERNEDTPSSIETSFIGLIPVHKHRKSVGLDEEEDGMCSICLCEFEEGEELRTLPECQHSYHAPCIDMWLFSHPNCPMCRTDATPSPSPSPSPHIQIIHIPDSGVRSPMMNHPLSHHPLYNHRSSSVPQAGIDVLSMSV